MQKCVVLRLFASHPQSSSTNARVATPHSSVASSSVAIAPSRQRTGVAGSESCPPPSPRCALRAMPWHRGCHSKHTPPLCHARIVQRDLELDFDPRSPDWTGPYTTCRFWALWKNSSGPWNLARRKAVLGIVFPALYDDAPGHTPILRAEILIFWPPSCHARGKWRVAYDRCAGGQGLARS